MVEYFLHFHADRTYIDAPIYLLSVTAWITLNHEGSLVERRVRAEMTSSSDLRFRAAEPGKKGFEPLPYTI